MSSSFVLPDAASLVDLRTYLGRASRLEDGSVRLVATSGVLAVYTPILYPVGLLDRVPTVLGLRVFGLDDPAVFDVVVPIRSMLDRLARLGTPRGVSDDGLGPDGATERPFRVELPFEVQTVTWAAISPPRAGWAPLADLDVAALRRAAHEGIADVADAVPRASGDAVVRRVRAEVWGRPVTGADQVPAGAAFAAESLGFLTDEEAVHLFESGAWIRLTSARGHVLVKSRRG